MAFFINPSRNKTLQLAYELMDKARRAEKKEAVKTEEPKPAKAPAAKKPAAKKAAKKAKR